MAYVEDILKSFFKAEKRRLRLAGPVDIAPAVMAAITKKKVAMHSAWRFRLKQTTRITGCALLSIGAIMALNVGLVIMQRNGSLEFINFGSYGIPPIAETLPVDYIAAMLVLGIFGYSILRTFSLVTHHSHLRLAALYALFIFGVSLSFSFSGVNDSLLALNPSGKALADLLSKNYLTGYHYNLNENNALIGKIIKSSPSQLTVETPKHTVMTLTSSDNSPQPAFTEPFFTQGQIIKAVGDKRGDVFYVSYADTVGPHGLEYFQNSPSIETIPTAVPSVSP